MNVSYGCACGQQILLQNPFLTGAGVPQVCEGQLRLCLWSVKTVPESFFCHGAAGTGTGVPPVIELGQFCLWSVHAVAEPIAVMEKWDLSSSSV